MQTIGERLEEARKHKGISLREAAEATKIRGEYLAAFETNSFQIDLPEIYIRGFLRNYANFLKLNGERILTDYDALSSSETPQSYAPAKREGRSESFGRMDLGESEDSGTAVVTDERQQAGREADAPSDRRRESAPFGGEQGPDRSLYLKIGGLVAAGVFGVILVLYMVVSVIGSDPADRADPADEDVEGTRELFLVGRGDIDEVRVVEIDTDEVLYDGSLSEGSRVSIRRRGPVEIVVSHREYLRLEEDGRGGNTPGSGRGRARWEGWPE